jgi:hypothetical protein
VKKIVEYASGDYQKASLLGTVTEKYAFVVFDYDNPNHFNACKVLGFQIKRSIRFIFVPAEKIYLRVNRWMRENKL